MAGAARLAGVRARQGQQTQDGDGAVEAERAGRAPLERALLQQVGENGPPVPDGAFDPGVVSRGQRA